MALVLVLPLVEPTAPGLALTSTERLKEYAAAHPEAASDGGLAADVLLAYRREVMQGAVANVHVSGTAGHAKRLEALLNRDLGARKWYRPGSGAASGPAAERAVRRAACYPALVVAVQDAFRSLPGYHCLVASALVAFVSERYEQQHARADVRLGAALFDALHRVLPAGAAFSVVAERLAPVVRSGSVAPLLEAEGDGPTEAEFAARLRQAVLPDGVVLPPEQGQSWHQAARFGSVAGADASGAAPLGRRDWVDVADREWLRHCVLQLRRTRNAPRLAQLSALMHGPSRSLDESAAWQSRNDGPRAATLLEVARQLVELVG